MPYMNVDGKAVSTVYSNQLNSKIIGQQFPITLIYYSLLNGMHILYKSFVFEYWLMNQVKY